jgi:outer membrane protein insertion porin family
VLLHLSEGPRYTVNRITFVGNTRTHDDVIRREMLLVEGALFSTVALRESMRRLNQLGYFKPLAGTEKEIQITKAVDRDDAVDVTRLRSKNRIATSFSTAAACLRATASLATCRTPSS